MDIKYNNNNDNKNNNYGRGHNLIKKNLKLKLDL